MSRYTSVSITEYNSKYRNQIALMASNTVQGYKKILSDLKWLDTILAISSGVVQGLVAYNINSIGDTRVGYIYYLLTQHGNSETAKFLLREVERRLVSRNVCMIVAITENHNRVFFFKEGYKPVDKTYLERIAPGVADKIPSDTLPAIKVVGECRKYHMPRSLTRFL